MKSVCQRAVHLIPMESVCSQQSTAGENRRLMLATVRRMRLKKACVQAIHNDLFEYHCGEAQNKAQQLKRFRKDFETLPVEELNRRLRFGVLTMCYDGEEI